MRKFYLCTIYCLTVVFVACAQDDYFTPLSPLRFSNHEFSEVAIAASITNQKKLFTKQELEELRAAIKKNNLTVDNQVAVIREQMTSLYSNKQELLKLKDLNKLYEHIAELEKNREEIQEQIRNDLLNIQFQGLYIVVTDSIDAFQSKELLARAAEHYLAPTAISDLNGLFLESFTKVRKRVLIEDRIRAVVSGQMSVENQLISKTFDGRKRFLCLLKVNVSPLKKASALSNPIEITQGHHYVVNPLSGPVYTSQLLSLGIPGEETHGLEQDINSLRPVIATANQIAQQRQHEILANGNENITRVNDEIGKMRVELGNRSKLLRLFIETKTDIPFDSTKLSICIGNALRYFDVKVNELQSRLFSIKEKELIERSNVSVTIEGRPADDIAKTAAGLLGQITQSYSKVEQFMNQTEISNMMLVTEEIRQKIDISRVPEMVWLFPVAGDYDNFYLTIVVRFRVIHHAVNPEDMVLQEEVIESSVPEIKPTVQEKKRIDKSEIKTGIYSFLEQPSVRHQFSCYNQVFVQEIDLSNALWFTPTEETIHEVNKDLIESIRDALQESVDEDLEVILLTKNEIDELPQDCNAGVIRSVLDDYVTIRSGSQYIGRATATFYGFRNPRSHSYLFKLTVTESGRRHWGEQIPLQNAFEELEDEIGEQLEDMNASVLKSCFDKRKCRRW